MSIPQGDRTNQAHFRIFINATPEMCIIILNETLEPIQATSHGNMLFFISFELWLAVNVGRSISLNPRDSQTRCTIQLN